MLATAQLVAAQGARNQSAKQSAMLLAFSTLSLLQYHVDTNSDGLAETECYGGQMWTPCGSACERSCDDERSEPRPCSSQCVPKCECISHQLWTGMRRFFPKLKEKSCMEVSQFRPHTNRACVCGHEKPMHFADEHHNHNVARFSIYQQSKCSWQCRQQPKVEL